MLRQVRNLVEFGRFRTAGSTSRTGKPSFLQSHRRAEFSEYLELIATQYCRPAQGFFFVQIGAFDGVTGDPLHRLVHRYGWRGVLIEPQRRAFETLKANYASQSQVKFFNVAIGPKDGELTLFTRKSKDISVAGTRRRLLINPGHGRDEIQSYAVPCWTLETLLTHAGADTKIDLLQIDAEGNDYDIIHSIDYRRIKPTILRYEHLLMSHQQKNACMALLAGHGYRFIVEEDDTLALAARLPDEATSHAQQ